MPRFSLYLVSPAEVLHASFRKFLFCFFASIAYDAVQSAGVARLPSSVFFLRELHPQYRVGVAAVVGFAAADGLEAVFFVKAAGARVLFVDVDGTDAAR